MGDALRGFLEVITVLLFLAILPSFLLWEILVVNPLGVWTWVILGVTISPFIACFYIVMRKRAVKFWNQIFAKPKEWNIDKTLNEYEALIKKKSSTSDT